MQTQTPPAQTHTLDSLRTALVTHKPHLEPVLTTVFHELEQPETPTEKIAEQLRTVLERDVSSAETEADRSFTWRNQAEREIVLTIPRTAPQAEAPTQEEAPAAEATPEPQPAEAPTKEATEASPAADATPAAQAAPAPEPEAAQDDDGDDNESSGSQPVSLLRELDVLLEQTNLHLMVMRAGEREGERLLSVTVVPQAASEKTDPALLTPINLTGTIPELEAGLPRAIAATHEGNQSIEDAIRELEEAKKEAAAAKKAEAAKAKKGGKKSATAKKDDTKKADAKKDEAKKDEGKADEKKAEEKKAESAATPMFETSES